MLENLKKYDVVLASNSPRRKELLAGLGINFRVEVLDGVDESYPPSMPAQDVAPHIARVKADAYDVPAGELLITADTVVIVDNDILGKPVDSEQASAMLQRLSGRTHDVVTGVCVKTQQRTEVFSCTSVVEFASLSPDEIDHYVSCYRPMDKAGAYGIQEWIGYVGVKGIKGSYFNVMGLPIQRLYTLLKTF
ncbi:MAG: septum formation protein Maf [Muribaculaceae bacterium]|nr:septum formation protein Maf [Muribaculaceae bacterium]